MKTRHALLGAAAVTLIAYAVWAWLPSEERRIRERLHTLADAVSTAPGAGDIAQLARYAAIRKGLAEDASLDPGEGHEPIEGRDSLILLIGRAAPPGQEWRVTLSDLVLKLDPPRQNASVSCTARASGSDAGGQEIVDAREMRIDMRKVDGEWLVAHVAFVRTLEPVS